MRIEQVFLEGAAFRYGFYRLRLMLAARGFQMALHFGEYWALSRIPSLSDFAPRWYAIRIILHLLGPFHWGFNEPHREEIRRLKKAAWMADWHRLLNQRLCTSIVVAVLVLLLGSGFAASGSHSSAGAAWILYAAFSLALDQFVQNVHSSVYAFSRIRRPFWGFLVLEALRSSLVLVAAAVGSGIWIPLWLAGAQGVIAGLHLHWITRMAAALRVPHGLRRPRFGKWRPLAFISRQGVLSLQAGFSLLAIKLMALIPVPFFSALIQAGGVPHREAWLLPYVAFPVLLLPFDVLQSFFADLRKFNRPGLGPLSQSMERLVGGWTLGLSALGAGVLLGLGWAWMADGMGFAQVLVFVLFWMAWSTMVERLFRQWAQRRWISAGIWAAVLMMVPRFGKSPFEWELVAVAYAAAMSLLLSRLAAWQSRRRSADSGGGHCGVRLDLSRAGVFAGSIIAKVERALDAEGLVVRRGRNLLAWPASKGRPSLDQQLSIFGPLFIEWVDRVDLADGSADADWGRPWQGFSAELKTELKKRIAGDHDLVLLRSMLMAVLERRRNRVRFRGLEFRSDGRGGLRWASEPAEATRRGDPVP